MLDYVPTTPEHVISATTHTVGTLHMPGTHMLVLAQCAAAIFGVSCAPVGQESTSSPCGFQALPFGEQIVYWLRLQV